MSSFIARCALLCIVLLSSVRPAAATWSICIADSESREVAMGTVTCLNNFDLLALVSVIAVEKGAAAVQSAGDFDGVRRPIIFEELLKGTSPEEILEILSDVAGHPQRQYGIADTQVRSATFSGAENGPWAGGQTFAIGSTTYAIQGNVLAGACVVDGIRTAIEGVAAEGGDIPEQLMAGMEGAAAAGGDGRCSCFPGDPEACGCPVPDFDKSGHIGGMVVSRVGDTDDPACDIDGCADGDYFMRLNVAFQANEEPDPAAQLRDQFDAWRAAHAGRPDAVHSVVGFDPPFVTANGVSTTTMRVELRDWRDLTMTVDIADFDVTHAAGSAGLATIGDVVDLGDGVFGVTLTAGTTPGIDRFTIVVDDGVRAVTLTPEARFVHYPLGDADGNGIVDFRDMIVILAGWGPCPAIPTGSGGHGACPGDVDGNGVVDCADLLVVVGAWSTRGACCFDDGICGLRSSFQCALGDGVFLGEGTTCEDVCPRGACCIAGGGCRTVPDVRCAILGGVFQGDGSACGDGVCENNQCDGAILVHEGTFAFSTVDSTTDGPATLPPECNEGGGVLFVKDVWYLYEPTCDGTATVSVCASDFNTRLAIYEEGDCPGPFLACNDDACGDGGTRSEVSFPVTAGVRSLIRIGSRNAVGDGTLVISCEP